MIAALPMYDRPELRAETDALWAAIRDRLRARGIDAPETLTRDREIWDIWTDPDLILAQTCGLPFATGLAGKVALVGAPDFGLPGCAPGQYASVIISPHATFPDRPRAAINSADSQSGWGALHAWATARAIPLGPVTATGAHALSARAVAEGQADVAAIDAQTWRQLVRFDGADPALVIARTPGTPATPFICAAGQDPAPIRAALTEALAALPRSTRAALNLRGVVTLEPAAYRAIPIPPNPSSIA